MSKEIFNIESRYSSEIKFSSANYDDFEGTSKNDFILFLIKKKFNLNSTDLREANLYKANLEEANLEEANLSGANLYKASLEEANLYKANLEESKNRNIFKMENFYYCFNPFSEINYRLCNKNWL